MDDAVEAGAPAPWQCSRCGCGNETGTSRCAACQCKYKEVLGADDDLNAAAQSACNRVVATGDRRDGPLGHRHIYNACAGPHCPCWKDTLALTRAAIAAHGSVLKAENARLRKALKPFAKLARSYDDGEVDWPNSCPVTLNPDSGDRRLTIAHLRAARIELEEADAG